MKGRSPTREEKRYMDKTCSLGCCVCRIFHSIFSPASPHHIEGRTKEGAHFKVIPLCHKHHQLDDSDPNYESVHGNKFRFEERYGTQLSLLKSQNELLEAI